MCWKLFWATLSSTKIRRLLLALLVLILYRALNEHTASALQTIVRPQS